MVDWTRQSLGIFSNVKWLQHCLWGGKKSPPTQRVLFMEISKGSENQKCLSSGTWRGAPFWHSAPLWYSVSKQVPIEQRQSSKELCPGLRAISLSSICRWRKRRHLVAVYASMLFTKWLIYWKHESVYWNTNPKRFFFQKKVSSAPEKVHDKHFLIISNSIWFLKRGRKLKISSTFDSQCCCKNICDLISS